MCTEACANVCERMRANSLGDVHRSAEKRKDAQRSAEMRIEAQKSAEKRIGAQRSEVCRGAHRSAEE